jgi:hypothetical protein
MRQLYSIFSEELDDEDIIKYLKEVCNKYGSESIIKFLDDRNIESIDMDKFNEKSMVILYIYNYNYRMMWLL